MPFLNQLRAAWLRVPIRVVGTIALISIVSSLIITLLRPMPQRTIVMAVYPEGSLNAEVGRKYQDILGRDGIQLKLAPSKGAVESISRLRDPNSGISIALVPDGITTERDSPELVSLGTLFYQPLWIFSRAPSSQQHKQLQKLRISIGPEGSSSHALALELLERAGIIDQNSATLFSLNPMESAEKLTRGDIDAAVFLDSWRSPVVQQLLKDKSVNLESIPMADAFVALYPYLTKLVLPKGVVDMVEPRPASDVILIAPKSSLIVRKDVHPAIQYLLLEAAEEIHSTAGVFNKADRFPAPESTDLPLSPYAREFYKSGRPFLQRHLPFWLAVFLEQPLVWFIPLLLLLLPVLRLVPAAYDWIERRRVYRLYAELKHLEDAIMLVPANTAAKDLIERLDHLEHRATHLSLPAAFKPLVYALRLHIDLVRHRAKSFHDSA